MESKGKEHLACNGATAGVNQQAGLSFQLLRCVDRADS